MRILFAVFLLACVKNCVAQNNTYNKSTSANTKISHPDTLNKDVALKQSIEQLLNIPLPFKVKKCSVTLSTRNRGIYITGYELNETDKMSGQILGFIAAALKGDRLIFSEIIVSKGEKNLRWAIKTFIIP